MNEKVLRFLLKFSAWLASILMLTGLTVVIGGYLYLEPKLPSIEVLKDVRMQVPLRIYSRDGKLMSEFGEKKREPLAYNQLPPQLVHAFLAAEDDRYFEHPGVDYQGLVRAVVQLVLTGKRSQGGSTITMQVARNFFLSSEKTYSRKINEILLALKIDRELSKEDVLELYLNKIYLGNRAYGVGAAAQVYYGKGVAELNLAEIAMIAGLPKAPSRYNPIINPARALLRRNYVLGRMLELGRINDAQYQKAKAAPVTASLHSVEIELKAPYVAEMVRREMVERYGQDAYTNGYSVMTTLDSRLQLAAEKALRSNLEDYDKRHGYHGPEKKIENIGDTEPELAELLSGVDPVGRLLPALVIAVDKQKADIYIKDLGRAVIEWDGMSWARRYLSENRRDRKPRQASDILKRGDLIRVVVETRENGAIGWLLSQVPRVQSALVSLDPQDGGIRALVGGYDFYTSKFNRATQAKRQPGSGFKPMVYSAALEAGFTAATLINDAPIVFSDLSLQSAEWRPENYSGKFYGPTRLRKALAHSRNLVSIRILRDIGIPYAIEYAKKFGFDDEAMPKNLSLSLGTGIVTPITMAKAYCVLANGGFLIEPYAIDRVEEVERGVVYQANPQRACRDCDIKTRSDGAVAADIGMSEAKSAPRILTAQNHYLINSIMQDVIQEGTATKAKELGRKDLAGKTGTTNDQRDAWFNGFHPSLVAVVWVGFDDTSPLGKNETGGKAALPAWIAYMKEALKDVPEQPLQMPAGMYSLRIDPQTGRPAEPNQPNAIFEAFRVGGPARAMPDATAAENGGATTVTPPVQPVETVSEDLF